MLHAAVHARQHEVPGATQRKLSAPSMGSLQIVAV